MIILLASLSFCYLAVLVLYRVFFHPLHKYPGPIVAAITGWYEVYYNIVQNGGLVSEIERLHKLYDEYFHLSLSPVVRVGPNALHFNDRRAYHDIYTHGATLVKEPHFYRGFTAHAPQSSVGFSDPQKAKNRRNLLASSFSRQAVMKLEYTIQSKVDQLIAIIQKHYNSPDTSVKISAAYRSLTTDVITDYCFANSTDTLADPNFSHPIVQSTRDRIKRAWVQIYFPFIIHLVTSAPRTLVLWFFPSFTTYMEMKTRYERQIDSFLNDPEALSTVGRETVYHHLLEPKDPELRPSRASLIHEAFILVSAGSDTVGHACTVGTYYALKDRLISSKLAEELKEAWPEGGRPLNFTALEKLPYLTAFIKEALRMSIGVIHPLPRIVGQKTPEIFGLRIPPGTIVEMSAYFMHMNPEIFKDPHTFNPDRWLDGNNNDMMLDLVTFSKGPRQCLAWSELYLILGNVFRKLNLKLVGENMYVFLAY
ncbi:hypothetical protein GYMLUDRAFT_159069 [Collybiopsis luxurians FD-317 M1]|nr:hypothetical protein GYMLUDRAFT_159069 [Collybiopsis luxurians FD-317 M1]